MSGGFESLSGLLATDWLLGLDWFLAGLELVVMEPVERVLSWVAGIFGLFRSGTCAPVTLLVFTFVPNRIL